VPLRPSPEVFIVSVPSFATAPEAAIVNVSVVAFVVNVMPVPAAIVRVSEATSATMGDCPETEIVAKAKPLPPPLPVLIASAILADLDNNIFLFEKLLSGISINTSSPGLNESSFKEKASYSTP